jgi:hypothetical protein
MGVFYGDKFQGADNFSVWPVFRDNQIACNGYPRGERSDIDEILDKIRYDDYVVLKSFAPNVGLCVYGVGRVIGMNTYPFPIPDGYRNQCVKLNWILRSVDDKYAKNFPTLVGAPYANQLFEFPTGGISEISDWLNKIGIRAK